MKINMPDCCPMEPQKGKLFCVTHSNQLREAGLPDDLLGFVKKIRKDTLSEIPEDIFLTPEEHCALDEILKRARDSQVEKSSSSMTTADTQGYK